MQVSIVSGLPTRSEVLSSDNVIVGRAADADLILNHPEVSRRHCRIQHEGESWFVEDLGSRRGTAVNGNRISERTALLPGDRVQLGPVTFAFGLSDQKAQVTRVAADPIGAVLYKRAPAITIPLSANLVFGRGDEVDVDLDDPAVSRRHATIEARSEGFRLVDLKSKSGSFVNGRRFVDHELVIGDQIQFGPFVFI